MKSNTASSASGCLKFIATELIPLGISIVALILSIFNFYINYLKSPEISFVVAPYISHVVDDASRNEAFFIPLTVINRGARPGTVLSFELTVTHELTQNKADYFGQYFAKKDDQRIIGDLFSPMSLQDYSTGSQTVCFYPIGSHPGNFFSEAGVYDFAVKALVANVQNNAQRSITQNFHVIVTDEMVAVMRTQPDGEYPYPLRAELVQ
jgi:hypothetical protein